MARKSIVLLTDGMSGHRINEIGGRTIMQYADTPNFERLAREGVCGFIKTAPTGMYPGSDTCNLSVMGYDPREYYSGRSPLEAASIGIELGENDITLRCNVVTLTDDGKVMEDFSAHHLKQETAARLVKRLQDMFDGEVEFHEGVGYRHIMVIRDADVAFETTAPHDIMGREIDQYMPKGKGSEKLIEIMERASKIFQEENFDKANAIWLWGEGSKPTMPTFKELYGMDGAVVAAVDLVKGIGAFAGLEIIEVEGATGFIDTNFKGKAEAAVKALDDVDYVFLHVEAADEAGHMGSIKEKKRAVENIDSLMLPTLIEGLQKHDEYRLLITPDHPTPVELRTHVSEPVPALIWGSGVEPDKNTEYNEFIEPSFNIVDGFRIAEYFLKSPVIKGKQ